MKMLVIVALASFFLIGLAIAQDNACALKPPKGASVALVEFEDLQCPDCAKVAPVVADAAATYKIPVVLHAFPLTKHAWAHSAAVYAAFFDQYAAKQKGKTKKLGSGFRTYMYENQASVTPQNLRETVERFAKAHGVKLPEQIDPKGKLAARVDTDIACGKSLNVVHTPTIYVVSSKQQGEPFIEVVDRSKLFEQIEAMTPDKSPEKATAKRAPASKK